MSNKEKELNSDLKFGLKSFITICSILLSIMVFVGILTFIVPAGQYALDESGKVIPGSFSFIESTTTLPVWRWFTAPIEALLFGSGSFNIIQIIAVLLVLGGTFKVLDKAGLLVAIVHVIVDKFYEKRYLLIWIITLIMMLLASCFGLQEELLILNIVLIQDYMSLLTIIYLGQGIITTNIHLLICLKIMDIKQVLFILMTVSFIIEQTCISHMDMIIHIS